ncbi:NAD(P)H-hydrate epimerase [[Clostridium] fimetarium]|uniref:Multifunctional fusion protein n=1 Tax=[Clostridium] fimetarium TaxID=99656 RepID=A0A1I0RJI2_9FIRM|nr:NAD(P)H-hydrate epimerase [[Clostridium] fimetarium]SEW41184.1 yjeF C-terminal region, hydroxyethylthiazole kinase-related/yjeF N-terminal region [[Clostridium] fimetarium]
MKYVLDSKQMKQVDNFSIKRIGMPSLVLMERAALGVAGLIESKFSEKSKIVCVCGSGNNGADGIAVARILFEKGYDVTILAGVVGTSEGETQLSIAKKSGIKIKKYTRNKIKLNEYNLIIDAIFGIGLLRNIEGNYADLVSAVNDSKAKVVSVDIPSGINSTTGQIMGTAVKADYTVTFGYKKIGLLLYPGADYSGKVKVVDIGFPKTVIRKIAKKAFTFTGDDINLIPKRMKNSNKGMYGKVLVIAGSEYIGGAACLAGMSAYRSGVGLVKVLTHQNNRDAILKAVPEALISTYNSNYGVEQIESIISNELEWASCIIIGPGISKSEIAVTLTKYVIGNTKVPTIIDADALNIMANIIADAKTGANTEAKIETNTEAKIESKIESKIETNIEANIEAKIEAKIEDNTEAKIETNTAAKIEANTEANIEANTEANTEANAETKTETKIETKINKNIFTNEDGVSFILTPHIGEMERISGFDKRTIKSDPIKYASEFVKYFSKTYSENLNIICVMKDARTIVTDSNGCAYINTSGNSGMAKGGSGDVLTGVIAGLISNKMSCFDAACMGVYVHGLAGDESAIKKGQYGMKAGDIIDNICAAMK